MPLFNDIDDLEAYVDFYIKANGAQEITGPQANVSLNGCIEFIRQSPLNYAKAQVSAVSSGVVNALAPVVVFTNSSTPTSLTFTDNIYHEYIFINMSPLPIILTSPLVYYSLTGGALTTIPASTAINIFKAANDLWVMGNNANTGGGGGSVQRKPETFVVGTTPNAPTASSNTWTLPIFLSAYVVLILNRVPVDLINVGDGGPFITKALGSDTLTIGNYSTGWNNGDVLTYILITP